jgi:hypothetical protein
LKDKEINRYELRQVEKKNKVIVQECTSPSTAGGNYSKYEDTGSPSQRDIPDSGKKENISGYW